MYGIYEGINFRKIIMNNRHGAREFERDKIRYLDLILTYCIKELCGQAMRCCIHSIRCVSDMIYYSINISTR